jgi:hypothetical protein
LGRQFSNLLTYLCLFKYYTEQGPNSPAFRHIDCLFQAKRVITNTLLYAQI